MANPELPPTSRLTSPGTQPFTDHEAANVIYREGTNGHFQHSKSLSETMRQTSLRKRRRKQETIWGSLRSSLVNHQLGISVNLIILLALAHVFFPRARPHTRKFFQLSHPAYSTVLFNRGYNDLYFVVFWIVVFTGLRVAVMSYLLNPLAERAGIASAKAKTRFAEQAWLFLYYSSSCLLGMFIIYHSSYWFNLHELWTEFPVRSMSSTLKIYYLVQFAFYVQQLVVVNIEERRKDHWQMFTHHVITCMLLFTSYGYYQTKVGNAILCLMDTVDVVFSLAKILRYVGYQTACDVAFGVFILSWFMARHVFYLMICWSIHTIVPTTMAYGCYSSITGQKVQGVNEDSEVLRHLLQPFINPGGPVCFNRKIRYSFLGMLLFLQGITVMWFLMIIRVAVRVLQGEPADDSRSDDEGDTNPIEEDEEDEEEEEIHRWRVDSLSEQDNQTHKPFMKAHTQPMDQLVEVDQLSSLKRRGSPTMRYRSRKSGTSGFSDHKELLGRIGCDKPS